MKHIVVLGGAGYLGLFYIHFIKERHPDAIVTIVTRNLTKEVFFKGVDVMLSANVDSIKGENIVIINLAYSIGTYFNDTKEMNYKIIQQVETLVGNNIVSKIIHVSSIVLSQEQQILDVSEILNNETYYYAKSYAEAELKKIFDKYKVPTIILRSGNIVGPGSPWIAQLLHNLYDGLPVTGKSDNYPSNTTFVGNLVFAIDWLTNHSFSKAITVMDFCEFGNVSWTTWITELNKKYQKPVIKWEANSAEELRPNLREDLRNFKSVMMALAIPTLFKGRKTNSLIIRVISFFGLAKAKEKAKEKIRKLNTDKSNYMYLMEYSAARVYMNTTGKKLVNVPEDLKISLPYDFETSIKIICQWIDFAGFNSLFNKR